MDFEDIIIYAAEVVGLVLLPYLVFSLSPLGRALAERVRRSSRVPVEFQDLEELYARVEELETLAGLRSDTPNRLDMPYPRRSLGLSVDDEVTPH